MKPQIEESWLNVLSTEFEQPYFANLKAFLLEEKRQYLVYPPGSLIFSAFAHTPFFNVKVVILGQDPYHGRVRLTGFVFLFPTG